MVSASVFAEATTGHGSPTYWSAHLCKR